MFARARLIAGACAVGVGLSAAAQAAGAPGGGGAEADPASAPKLEILERPAERFRRSVATHRARLRAASRNESGGESAGIPPPEHYGVSGPTLDAIAACESGGDPSAVSADGTYRGKYQFDYATWASVGGSGDPAAAPEAEQDMRAAMLYAQGGASPWPICG